MKIWAYIILIGLLIGAASVAYIKIDSAGYNRAVVEQQAAGIKAQNEAIEERMAEWIATQAAAEPIIIIEEKIVEKIRVVEKDVPRIVEKIVQVKPDCADLGPEYSKLLNDSVRASNQRSDQSSAATDNLDAAL